MPVEEIEIIFNESSIVSSFENLQQSISDTNSAVETTNSTLESSFDPKNVNKFTKAVGDVEGEVKKASKGINELDKNTKKANNSVGQAATSVGVLGRGFSGARRQAQIFNRALKTIAANPVLAFFVAIVAVATAIFKAFKSTKEGSEALAIGVAVLEGIFGVLRDTLLALVEGLANLSFESAKNAFFSLGEAIKTNVINRLKGLLVLGEAVIKSVKAIGNLSLDELKEAASDAAQALVQIGTGFDKQQQDDFVNGIQEGAKALVDAAKAAAAAQAEIEEVKNAERALSVQRAKLNTQLVEARDIAQDTTKSFVDRIDAINKVTAAENAQVQNEIATQRKLVAALKAKDAISRSSEASLNEIAQAEVKLANLQTQSKTRLLTIDRQRLTLEKQLLVEQKKAADFIQDLQLQQITDAQKLAEERLKLEKAARDENINGLLLSEEERKAALVASQKILDKRLLELTNERLEKEKQANAQAANEELQRELARINTRAEIANLEFTQKQEQERQLFAETARTAEEVTEFEKRQGDEQVANELRVQQARLKAIRQFSKDATAEEKERLDAQIALLETQLQGVGKVIVQQQEQQKAGGLLGLLGLSQNQEQQFNALKSAVGTALNVVKEGVAERIAALQQEVDFRNQRVSEIQSDLNNEIELAKLGKAANISQLQEQLEAEKQARAKAEQDKKDAAKAQFAIDTALQASNLATSISSLYASLASLPFGIGVAVATALSGVLLGSFAASKVKAAQLAGFRTGGYTGDGGISDIAGVTHGQEFVLDANTTKQFGLNGMNMQQGKKHLLNNVIGNHNTDIEGSVKHIRLNNKIEQQNMYKAVLQEQVNELRAVKDAIKSKEIVIPMPNGSTVVKSTDGKGNISKQVFKK